MVNRTELRLGNYIHHKGCNAPCKVTSGDFIINVECSPGINWFQFGENDFDPILLTYEILDACGFNIESSFSTQHLSPIHLQREEDGWYMKLHSGYVNKVPIKFLHHLQNLYFDLVGKELEVKLDTPIVTQ